MWPIIQESIESYQLLLPGTDIPLPGLLKEPGGPALPLAFLLSELVPPAVTTALPWIVLESGPVLPFPNPILGELAYAAASLKSSIDVPNISFFNSDE